MMVPDMSQQRLSFAVLLALLVAAPAAGQAQAPTQPAGSTRRAEQTARVPAIPAVLEFVGAKDGPHQVTMAAIKQAAVGKLSRYSGTFDYTPFTTVMRLAGVPANAQVRVIGEMGAELTLQAGVNAERAEDPAKFAIIFNMQGLALLTPMPDPASSTRPPRAPAGAITTRGGYRAGGAPGAAPPAPEGFSPLKEVRRIQQVVIIP